MTVDRATLLRFRDRVRGLATLTRDERHCDRLGGYDVGAPGCCLRCDVARLLGDNAFGQGKRTDGEPT